MIKRLRAQFGLDRFDKVKESEKCPGEQNCGMFKIALRESGNGLDACASCSMLATKDAPADAPDDSFDTLFAVIEDSRARHKLTGDLRGFQDRELTAIQFEILVMYEQFIENFERESAARARIAQEDNLQRLTEMVKALSGLK